ncbi:MAG TPA: serine hydrolase [Bacteroidales bacterium]|nr:serine hydrolase [Bacteroidales bacterium]
MQQYLFAQGFDPAWANRFQTVLDSVVALHPSLGVSVAVYVPSEGIWEGASGVTSSGVPMTTEMRLNIGSNTKTFTSALMLKLQEMGILSLEDHLYQWLPSFSKVDSTVTLRQLLSHQSGIYDHAMNNNFWSAIWADTSHFWTPQEVLAYLHNPTFPAGGGMSYSNANYLLAGMVIEAVTGNTLVQALHQFIFDPLDMDSTFVGAFESPNGPVAPWCSGTWINNYPITSLFSTGAATGSIFSTPREMCQWYRALFNAEIISDSSLLQMLDFESSSFYGLGVVCGWGESEYYPWYLHGGNLFSYNSQIIYDLKTQSVFCILANDLSEENCVAPIYPMMKVLYDGYPKKQRDAGITEIICPGIHICDTTLAPIVVLKNFGLDPLTSVIIHCFIDSGDTVQYTWTGFLTSGSTEDVTLDSISPEAGYHLLHCYTSLPNGGSEEYTINDTITKNFMVHGLSSLAVPWEENFEQTGFPPSGWIEDPLVSTQWGISSLVSYDGSACLVKGNYLDCYHIGIEYDLDLPRMDLSSISDPRLSFWYAYARTLGCNVFDSLRIMISQDSAATWQTLFYKGGLLLQTAFPVQRAFVPSPSHWKQEFISLSGYYGNVIIRFRLISGFNNNLYIDNVKVDYGEGTDEYGPEVRTITVYPNPFSSSATFCYSLDESAWVSLKIYNCIGQQLAVPVNEFQIEGIHSVKWNPAGLSSGIYYYRISTPAKGYTGKMVLLE